MQVGNSALCLGAHGGVAVAWPLSECPVSGSFVGAGVPGEWALPPRPVCVFAARRERYLWYSWVCSRAVSVLLIARAESKQGD